MDINTCSCNANRLNKCNDRYINILTDPYTYQLELSSRKVKIVVKDLHPFW